MNRLFFGDNLEVLRNSIADQSADLIYLDPPFNSNAYYNVIFGNSKTAGLPQAQITAFEDTWHWNDESSSALHELFDRCGKLAEILDLLVRNLGPNDLSAYLVMIAIRLVELHRVLKPTGSLYLHCDPTASHYLKLILDFIFGPHNYRSEITWKRSSAHHQTRSPSLWQHRRHPSLLQAINTHSTPSTHPTLRNTSRTSTKTLNPMGGAIS